VALTHPRDEVLVHDVRLDPAPGLRVFDRTIPPRDALLVERLHLFGDTIEEPPDAERGCIIDGHAPFEVVPGEQTVGPQTDPAARPQLVLLGLALANTPIREAVLELVEADAQVGGRLAPVVLAADAQPPVVVQPLEVDRINRVLLALEPVARDLAEDDLD